MSYKVYVPVTAHFDTDGKITPLSIEWTDGKVYEINRVFKIDRKASLKAGGLGMRYTCQIGNTTTYMWLDENRWFVEGKEEIKEPSE